MVHRDGPENCDVGFDDVCRIPFATHAHFDHRDIDRGVRKARQPENGQYFEISQARLALRDQLVVDHFDVRLDVEPVGHERIVAYWLAADADAFVEGDDVRAREQPGAQTVGAQDCFDHARDARLAVRARDVNHIKRAVHIAKKVGDAAGRLEARLRV